MPTSLNTEGYDPIISYSVKELAKMYMDDGISEKEAYQKAEIIKKEMYQLDKQEQRLWKKVRKHEIPMGDLIENF